MNEHSYCGCVYIFGLWDMRNLWQVLIQGVWLGLAERIVWRPWAFTSSIMSCFCFGEPPGPASASFCLSNPYVIDYRISDPRLGLQAEIAGSAGLPGGAWEAGRHRDQGGETHGCRACLSW